MSSHRTIEEIRETGPADFFEALRLRCWRDTHLPPPGNFKRIRAPRQDNRPPGNYSRKKARRK